MEMSGKVPNRIASGHELAIAIREQVPTRLYVEWQVVILEGAQPELVRGTKGDPDTWYVRPKQGGIVPTLEQQARALKDLMDRGHGQAVQSLALQGELRTLSLVAGQQLPSGQLTPAAIWAVEQAIRGALPGAGAPVSATASVIDAECVEAPASASADDDSSADDDDDQDLEQPAPTAASDHDDE